MYEKWAHPKRKETGDGSDDDVERTEEKKMKT